MPHINTKQDSETADTSYLVPIFMTAFFTISLLWMTAPNLFRTEKGIDQWDELKLASPAHVVIVEAYLDCRNNFFSGTVSECQLIALQYGRELGFNNADIVFEDIVVLSNQQRN